MVSSSPEAGPLARLPAGDRSDLVPSASAVLVRDASGGLEVLMLRRTATASFAAGAWVFPGGRVDAEDRAGEDRAGEDRAAGNGAGAEAGDPDWTGAEAAWARRAAVRETAEEAGLVVDPAGLRPLSRWTLPPGAPRRFQTWFFLGRAPDAAVVVDGQEIVDHSWLRPADALAARDAGELELLPPTWVTLWTLARQPDVDAVLRAVSVPESFQTQLARVPGGLIAMWHGDAGYDGGDPTLPGPRHRLLMLAGDWVYRRDAD
jgi:8-oxo-dGTP pyrophosphatase MutT (NUDIX family)